MNLTDDAGKNAKELKTKTLGFTMDDYEIRNVNSLGKHVVFGTYDMVEQENYVENVPAVEEIRNLLENPVDNSCLGSLEQEKMLAPYIEQFDLEVIVAVRDYFSEEQMKRSGKIFSNVLSMQKVRVVPDSTCVAAEIAHQYNSEVETKLEVINYTGTQVTKSLYEISVKNAEKKVENAKEEIKDNKDKNAEDKDAKSQEDKEEEAKEEENDEYIKKNTPKTFIRTVKWVESKIVEDDIGDEEIKHIVRKHLAKVVRERFAEMQIDVNFIGLEKLEKKYMCDVNPFVASAIMYIALGANHLKILEIYCHNVKNQNDNFVLIDLNVELGSVLRELQQRHKHIEFEDGVRGVRLSVYKERNNIFGENNEYTTHRNLIVNGMSAVCRKDLNLIDGRVKSEYMQLDPAYVMVRKEIRARKDASTAIAKKENILKEFDEKFSETKEYGNLVEAFKAVDNKLVNVQNLLRAINEMKKLKQKVEADQILLNSNINSFKYLVKTTPQKHGAILDQIKTEYDDASEYIKKNEFTKEELLKKENALRTAIFRVLNKIKQEEKRKKDEEEKRKKDKEEKMKKEETEEEKANMNEQENVDEAGASNIENENSSNNNVEKGYSNNNTENNNLSDNNSEKSDVNNNTGNNNSLGNDMFDFDKLQDLLGEKLPERMEAFKKLKDEFAKKKNISEENLKEVL